MCFFFFFFFQAEDGIRDLTVTGVQTCALPIWPRRVWVSAEAPMIATLSGENRGFRSGIGSAQPEAAGDDAAQHFAGAALDRQFGGDQGGVAQGLLEPVVVAVG